MNSSAIFNQLINQPICEDILANRPLVSEQIAKTAEQINSNEKSEAKVENEKNDAKNKNEEMEESAKEEVKDSKEAVPASAIPETGHLE